MSEVSTARTVSAAPGEQMAPGTRVGKYEVVHRIAFGGMAEIYLARAVGIHGFEKYVVLKRILPQHAANLEFVRMFLKEARVAATLDHANIAHVYEIGETQGNYFFTMEYLHGEDVRWVMHQLDLLGQRLPLEHALEIVVGAASGLHFAHEKRASDGRYLGIVHRDISPANLVVTYDGGVKVVDFGIAKLTADPERSQRYSLKGKLAYMSPEQLNTLPVDRRSDVFALGIVLYEITTHARLFKGETEVETMRALLAGHVPPPSTHVPGYPAALERIVLRALEAEPGKRYQSARDLQLDLEAFARDERLQVSSATLGEWMERTFGPKRELWHMLPATPRDATATTNVMSHRDIAAPKASAVDRSVPIDVSAPRRPRGRSWGGALATVALVIAAGSFWLARGLSHRDEAVAASGGPVVLVTEQGNVAVERQAVTPPPPAAAPVPAPPPETPTAQPPEAVAGRARHASPGRAHAKVAASPSAEGENFSATFARREGDIRRCFAGHSDVAGVGEVSLRFDVERDGHVSAVKVLPAAIADAPLGACLTKVGKSTVFSPRAAPLTFRIPLTVQLQGAVAHP